MENADDPDNDREVDLEVGDVIVYSMNDGADLVAVEVVSITEGARVNAETTRPGESPKIEFRGIGEYQGEEERLRLEFAFYDPADAAFDGAADLGVIAERIQSGLGTSVEQTTSIRLGDVDDTGMGSNDNGFRIEGVGADLSSLHSYTLEDGGSFTPEIEVDGFVRFRGTVNNPDDDIQLNYLNTDRFEVELLNDADRTAGFGFGFRQSSFTNAITTAENGTDSDNDGIADHLDLDSDNDGITDNIEAQTTADYIAPNADSEADYIANQGVNSAYVGIAGFDQANTDGDEYVDRLDLDSDNDGVLDIIESGLGNNDTDGDGRTDATVGFNGLDDSATHEAADDFTDVSGLGHDGSTFQLADSDDDTAADGSDATPTETDLDYRDNVEPVDTDGDGVADAIDIDDDNDGILDVDEAAELIAVQGQLGFFHNGESNSDGSQTFGVVSYDPGASPNVTDILDLSGQTPLTNNGQAANTDSRVGEGLSEDPSTTGFEFDLLGADSPDLATAIANDDFVEVYFKLAEGINDVTITETFHTLALQAGGGSNLGNYQLAAAISSDGFTSSDVLFDPYLIEPTIPDGSGPFQFTPQFPDELNSIALSGGAEYRIRFYIFDSQNPDELPRSMISSSDLARWTQATECRRVILMVMELSTAWTSTATMMASPIMWKLKQQATTLRQAALAEPKRLLIPTTMDWMIITKSKLVLLDSMRMVSAYCRSTPTVTGQLTTSTLTATTMV